MATETKEKTETNVESSAKCVAMIQRIDKGTAEVASFKIQLAKLALDEAARCGYTTENEVRKMLALSWRDARGFKSSDETLQAAFDQSARPDVSKIMRLAYPVEGAEKELEKAIAHNEKVGASRGRIGENRLLEVARGNLSYADAKAGKAKERKPRESALDSTVPPAERFHNAVAGLIAQYKGKLTIVEIEKIFDKIVSERQEVQKAA